MQKFSQRIMAAAAALLVMVTVTVAFGAGFVQTTPTPASAQTGPTDFATVYERVAPSVVSIQTITESRFNFGGGQGTGFVINTDGHIVTNAHVVFGADEIRVEFLDGLLTRAELVGQDLESDIAVIKVEVPADRLQPVQFADSNALFVGQPVAAIGSPFGQEWTMTTGIVSALNRTVQSLTEFLIGGVVQTDAAINPGNSGGPLVDAQGHVIGVNTQIISEERQNSGVGFAVPSNLAQRVAQNLIGDGEVSYSFIGISGLAMNLLLIEGFGLANDTRGVLIDNVLPGTGANAAGLQSANLDQLSEEELINGDFPDNYDIIIGVDGDTIRDFDTLISYLSANTLPGDTVTLEILRNGAEMIEVPVTLGERPAAEQAP